MGRPVTEVAIGSIDGSNQEFETSATYVPGSTRVYLNGQMKRPSFDDGHDELGGKLIRLKEAPQLGDVVQVRYNTVL